MFLPFLMLFSFISGDARINEYVPSIDIELHQFQHPTDINLPQSFTWSDVDGVNSTTSPFSNIKLFLIPVSLAALTFCSK